MSILEVFEAGGPLMWPLLLFSLLTVAIIIERMVNLRAGRILDPKIVERVTALAEGGQVKRARQVCKEHPGIFTNIVAAGLELVDQGELVAKDAVEDAGRRETSRLGRYLGALGTIAAVAPLLGLLGTVTGMIEVFDTIAKSGAGHAGELSSGISQALITTATGLLVAIPALIAHSVFSGKVANLVTELEDAALRAMHGFYRSPAGARDGAAVSGSPALATGGGE
jgi:biopolymer transport protein ExbB